MENLLTMTVDVCTWEECEQAWLSSCRSESTRRAYAQRINDFKAHSGITTMAEAGRRHVATWHTSMRERNLSDGTIQLSISALSSFYKFASCEYSITNELGENIPLLLGANPAAGKAYRRPLRLYGKARPLSVEETQSFLSIVPKNTLNGKRDFALLVGYLLLGRRNSEWRDASLDQFEMRDGKQFYRWSGKNHEDDLIEVPTAVWDALRDYITFSGGRGPFDYVFLDRTGNGPLSERRIGQIVQRYARLAGITDRIRVHDLRHTAAMLRRRAGADIKELQEFLGHRNPATTMVYLHRMEGLHDNRSAQVADMLKIGKVK